MSKAPAKKGLVMVIILLTVANIFLLLKVHTLSAKLIIIDDGASSKRMDENSASTEVTMFTNTGTPKENFVSTLERFEAKEDSGSSTSANISTDQHLIPPSHGWIKNQMDRALSILGCALISQIFRAQA
jgi:hypothetical protein